MMRVANCSADISSEKKPTMPPLASASFRRARLAAIGARDVEGDVGGERRLAHAGSAGDDDEVGGLQAAHLVVEVVEPGGDAAQVAVALVGLGGHVDGELQRLGEALESAAVFAALGDLIKALLRFLDLLARRRVDGRVIGDVDDVLADA